MVPLIERRHRLSNSEIPEVILGLRLRLRQLLEKKDEPKKAEVAAQCMIRLISNGKGRPKYGKFDWDYMSYLAEDDEVFAERIDSMRRGEPAD
jgi:hypothetical protein